MTCPKPNFFIVGAPKCATTSLYHCLKQHPSIYFSPMKEPNYFARSAGSGIAVDSLDQYMALFKDARQEPILAEASTGYFSFPGIANLLKDFNPNAKILISLRHPADRAFSHYASRREYGKTDLDFDYYIDNGLLTTVGANTFDISFYYERTKEYLSLFGPEKVKIIFHEDIKKDLAMVLRDICRFLGVNDQFAFKVVRANVTAPPARSRLAWASRFLANSSPTKTRLKKIVPSNLRSQLRKLVTSLYDRSKQRGDPAGKLIMSEEQRRRLINVYREDIIKLAELLEVDLSRWLK